MAAVLAVMFSSYREGSTSAEAAAAITSVRGYGMWAALQSVKRASTAAAATECIEEEHGAGGGLKGDSGRMLVDQV
jgi:hypothetical protein